VKLTAATHNITAAAGKTKARRFGAANANNTHSGMVVAIHHSAFIGSHQQKNVW
jgi:hypothetical protein